MRSHLVHRKLPFLFPTNSHDAMTHRFCILHSQMTQPAQALDGYESTPTAPWWDIHAPDTVENS